MSANLRARMCITEGRHGWASPRYVPMRARRDWHKGGRVLRASAPGGSCLATKNKLRIDAGMWVADFERAADPRRDPNR